MRRYLLPATHAVAVALVLSALLSLDVSVAAKVLLAAFGGLFVFTLFFLLEQAEQLHRMYATLRLIFVSVEKRRLDRGNRERAADILAADIQQEASDREIGKLLSGHRANSVLFWVVYVMAVALMTAIGVAAWQK